MRKLAERIAGKKMNRTKARKVIEGMTPEQKKQAFKPIGKDGCARPELKGKTVLKAAVKPKVMTQTPVGMANSTKSSPYIPPAKKTTKPNL